MNPTGLERFVPSLGLTPIRRYSALSATVAEGQRVNSIPNLGSIGGTLTPLVAERPVLSAHSGVQTLDGDGSSTKIFANEADAITTGPTTIYTVSRCVFPTTAKAIVGWGKTTNSGIRIGPAGQVYGYRGTGFQHATATITQGAFHILVLVSDGANSVLRVDDSEQAGTLGTTDLSTYPFGFNAADMESDVAEFGAFNGALNATQRNTLVSRLRAVYGL